MAVINNLLAEKSEIPLIIIASVSLGGLALLIINIALLHCYIQKRKGVKDSYSVGMFHLSQTLPSLLTIFWYFITME